MFVYTQLKLFCKQLFHWPKVTSFTNHLSAFIKIKKWLPTDRNLCLPGFNKIPSSPPQTFNKRKQTYENQTHEERLIKRRIYDKERRPPRQSKRDLENKYLYCIHELFVFNFKKSENYPLLIFEGAKILTSVLFVLEK